MIEKKVPTIAKNDRPIIVCRICRPVRRSFSSWKRPISCRWRPKDFDSKIPETDRVSSVTAVRSAYVLAVLVATSRRARPTFTVSQRKNGSMNSDSTVSCHDSRSIAISVLTITTMFDRMFETVSVNTACTPPTSFAMRDWISPVRVVVKNRRGMNCRWE